MDAATGMHMFSIIYMHMTGQVDKVSKVELGQVGSVTRISILVTKCASRGRAANPKIFCTCGVIFVRLTVSFLTHTLGSSYAEWLVINIQSFTPNITFYQKNTMTEVAALRVKVREMICNINDKRNECEGPVRYSTAATQ